ncbi:MAG: nucleotidyltransferase domain-containing protein [Proteobacteria bacterium]|nr:nucleotidyltransferase domain-containing protein [Pseudomonadota bacterium]
MVKKFTELEVNSILNDFLNKVQQHISIDIVVLFGSYAKGEAHLYSDMDLMLVSKDLPRNKTKGMNACYIFDLIGYESVPIDLELIAIHPSKLESPITKDFYDEILATGKVLR